MEPNLESEREQEVIRSTDRFFLVQRRDKTPFKTKLFRSWLQLYVVKRGKQTCSISVQLKSKLSGWCSCMSFFMLWFSHGKFIAESIHICIVSQTRQHIHTHTSHTHTIICAFWLVMLVINFWSASHDNWCTGTILNRITIALNFYIWKNKQANF